MSGIPEKPLVQHKKYLYSNDVPVPSMTAWRWKKKETANQSSQLSISDTIGSDVDNPREDSSLISEAPGCSGISCNMQSEMAEVEMLDESGEQISSGDSGDTSVDNINMEMHLLDEEEALDQEGEQDITSPTDAYSIWKSFDKPLFPNIPTTTAETILLLMNFVLNHNLPWSAMEELFTIMNVVLGQHVLPQTKHLLLKMFGGMNFEINFHYYCPDCQSYLGKLPGKNHTKETLMCLECKKTFHTMHLTNDGNFFICLPIAEQIKTMLSNNALSSELSNNLTEIHSRRSEKSVKDLTDGQLYKKKRAELQCTTDDLTVMFNTDGIPTSNSSKASMWPIQLVVNELPPKLRWQNIIVTGLWFGKSHPNMALFLNEFVKDMAVLSKEPIVWTANGRTYRSRVHVICACVDSPARAAIQNTKQYNGHFGCSWCLHPGITVEGSSQVKYVVMDTEIKDRTAQLMEADMKLALQTHSPVNGVKGPSPLINLSGFDIVWGLSPDAMHGLYMGVSNQITEIWLSMVDHASYIGSPNNLRVLDAQMARIKIPHIFTRYARSLSARKMWKANEWKHWLLYYSVPCLLGILPNDYLRHWCLLVEAGYLISKDEIQWSDINRIDELLCEFVIWTQILYGEMAMTSNIHQLLHYAKSVKLLGPAWSRSAFVFESNNGTLLKLTTASNGLPMQVMNRHLLKNKLKYIFSQSNVVNISERVQNAISNLQSYANIKNSLEVHEGGTVSYLLGSVQVALSRAEIDVLSRVIPGLRIETLELFSRMIIRTSNCKLMYHSRLYVRVKRMDNTVVRAFGFRYFCILKFFSYKDALGILKCGALAQELTSPCHANVMPLPPHIHRLEFPPKDLNLCIITANDINRISLLMDFQSDQYVCDIPNIVEHD